MPIPTAMASITSITRSFVAATLMSREPSCTITRARLFLKSPDVRAEEGSQRGTFPKQKGSPCRRKAPSVKCIAAITVEIDASYLGPRNQSRTRQCAAQFDRKAFWRN